MRKEPIYDTSNTLILNNQGATIYALRNNIQPSFTTEYETYIASTQENRQDYIEIIYDVYRELALRGMDTNMIRFYPINNRSAASSLIEFHGETALAAVGGDIDHEFNGLQGDGAALSYSTGTRMDTIITDVNNFSVGIYSQTDDDTGTDFGASTGANFCTIACKTGGNLVVKAGTTTVSGAISTGQGHSILNVQSGTVKAWHGKDKTLTEIGTSASIAGGLPSDSVVMCGENDDSTVTDYSAKRISCLWIYNGELTDDGIVFINSIIENYHLYNGNSVNYGA